MAKNKIIKAWGGFSDGELSYEDLSIGPDYPTKRLLAVYKTRSEARESYQDVRRIEIKYPIKD